MKKQIKGILSRLNLWNRYTPNLSLVNDLHGFFEEIHDFFEIPLDHIKQDYAFYKSYYERMEYKIKLGETKTLCLEEAFLIYLSAQKTRPRNFCEIGTQYAKSTRRIIDIFRLLDLNPTCYCYDIAKEIRYVSDDEVFFKIHDLTDDFAEEVLDKTSPDLIFLDAHPFNLLNKIIREFVIWSCSNPSILAIHDCSSGLFKPKMQIPKDQPSLVTSHTGLWERHVLAEIFQVDDDKLADLKTSTHRLKIFHTPHGLALIAPLHLLVTSEAAR